MSLIDKSQQLQNELEKYCENVYYQPPNNLQIKYPCIVYRRKNIGNIHGNNNVYLQNHSFEITVIDYDPDSEITESISKLILCRHDRHFKTEGLYHDIFTIFI